MSPIFPLTPICRAFFAKGVALGVGIALPTLAVAEGYEDLSADDAPAEPVKKQLTEQERIARKLEAQAKATGKGGSGRQSYSVSQIYCCNIIVLARLSLRS
jgi:hypothetical protein